MTVTGEESTEMETKEDGILLSQADDRAARCEDRYMVTYTAFLDLRQRSLVQEHLRYRGGLRYGFYGGYEEAERVMAVFLPDYVMEETAADYFEANPEEDPLTVLRLTLPKGAPHLTHRDYLGSLLGLGIDRSMTGDILVREDGADVLLRKDIAPFVSLHLVKAGRASLRVEEVPVRDLLVPVQNREERFVSVSSLRVDSVTAAAFGLSRGKAAEAIRTGLVFVNGREITKPDQLLAEGDKLVLRHKGKTVIESVGGRSAKGRTHLTILRYK